MFSKGLFLKGRYKSGLCGKGLEMNDELFLCPRIDRCFTTVRLSFHLSVCPSVCGKLKTVNLTFSYNFHTIHITMLILGMQVAFDNTQLVRVISSRARSNIKVTFLKKWPFVGQ